MGAHRLGLAATRLDLALFGEGNRRYRVETTDLPRRSQSGPVELCLIEAGMCQQIFDLLSIEDIVQPKLLAPWKLFDIRFKHGQAPPAPPFS